MSRSQTVALSELNLQKLDEYADSGSFPLPQQTNKPSVEQDSIQRLQVPHILQPTPLRTDIWLNQTSKYSVNTETENYDFFHKNKIIPPSNKQAVKTDFIEITQRDISSAKN